MARSWTEQNLEISVSFCTIPSNYHQILIMYTYIYIHILAESLNCAWYLGWSTCWRSRRQKDFWPHPKRARCDPGRSLKIHPKKARCAEIAEDHRRHKFNWYIQIRLYKVIPAPNIPYKMRGAKVCYISFYELPAAAPLGVTPPIL